jgi:hypothetical protein
MEDTIELDYIKKTYPGIENPILNAFDKKMIVTIRKVRAKYAECNRSYTILVSDDEGYRIQNKAEEIVCKPVAEIKTKPSTESKTCPAIKMDGCVCNAKLKNGNEYCGRHTKKV